MKGLVLSVFPGIDMLGRGFEAEGFCVVRGPDLIFGGDIRGFHVPGGVFVGVIGGSPCPDFSRARRGPPTGDGVAMLAEFRRVVTEAAPDWYLLENVPAAPDLRVSGYSFQRVDVDARDVGLEQRRLRHFQFGHAKRFALCLPRPGSRRDRPGEPDLHGVRGPARRSAVVVAVLSAAGSAGRFPAAVFHLGGEICRGRERRSLARRAGAGAGYSVLRRPVDPVRMWLRATDRGQTAVCVGCLSKAGAARP